ncbi:SDR family oxidoreductase [Thalassotalea maritima]|uniref:SDR family oxidoreductase n=1 Tax=Thalassotalea maritima TaxID=3242416 RepID=UPI0035274967
MSKTVLITGANRGIGLQMTRIFAERGDNVFAICRQRSTELDNLPVNIIEGIELTDHKSLLKLQQKLNSVTIDILINNAGILRDETLDDFNNKTIVDQFMINALAPLNVVQMLQQQLQPGAKVAFITSRMGSITDNSSGGRYGYRMSKAALNAGAVSLANDLRTHQVSVGIFHPGYVQTQMTQGRGDISSDQAASRLVGLIDALSLTNTGCFFHSNGEPLPW